MIENREILKIKILFIYFVEVNQHGFNISRTVGDIYSKIIIENQQRNGVIQLDIKKLDFQKIINMIEFIKIE